MASFGFPPFKVCFHIVGKAQPAEIVRVIVQGVAVDMVHGCLLLRVCVFAERRSDKATDKIIACLSLMAQGDTLITFVIHECM